METEQSLEKQTSEKKPIDSDVIGIDESGYSELHTDLAQNKASANGSSSPKGAKARQTIYQSTKKQNVVFSKNKR